MNKKNILLNRSKVAISDLSHMVDDYKSKDMDASTCILQYTFEIVL